MASRVLFLMMLVSSMVGRSDAAWCVCKPGANPSALQKTLDYACGAGADCNPIKNNGACFNPDNVAAHCSYAANSYYQRNTQNGATCDFQGTATLVNSDPSSNGCTYPPDSRSAGTSTTTPATSTPGTTTGTTPSSSFSPTTGGLGGLGPSQNGFVNDNSNSVSVEAAKIGFLITALICSGMALLS